MKFVYVMLMLCIFLPSVALSQGNTFGGGGSGGGGSVNSVSGTGSEVTSSGTTNVTIGLADITPAVSGVCTNCDLTVDTKGRITGKSNGTGGSGATASNGGVTAPVTLGATPDQFAVGCAIPGASCVAPLNNTDLHVSEAALFFDGTNIFLNTAGAGVIAKPSTTTGGEITLTEPSNNGGETFTLKVGNSSNLPSDYSCEIGTDGLVTLSQDCPLFDYDLNTARSIPYTRGLTTARIFEAKYVAPNPITQNRAQFIDDIHLYESAELIIQVKRYNRTHLDTPTNTWTYLDTKIIKEDLSDWPDLTLNFDSAMFGTCAERTCWDQVEFVAAASAALAAATITLTVITEPGSVQAANATEKCRIRGAWVISTFPADRDAGNSIGYQVNPVSGAGNIRYTAGGTPVTGFSNSLATTHYLQAMGSGGTGPPACQWSALDDDNVTYIILDIH